MTKLDTLSQQETNEVSGARSIPTPERMGELTPGQPITPPIFYTQALGEDGGDIPDDL